MVQSKRSKQFIFFLIIVFYTINTSAQIKNIGVPFIKNYKKTEYRAATQNWDIAQDKRGILYFANNDGIVEFDGNNWRTYKTIMGSIPRCLLIDDDNKIWTGAFNDFGYLEINESGNYFYNSIKSNLLGDEVKFDEIWKIHKASNGIYFQAMDALFFYDYETIKKIEDYRNYHFSFYVNNRFFIQEKTIGLLELRGNKLYLVEGGEIFKGDVEVWEMLSISADSIIIATQQHGLFLFDGYKISEYDYLLNERLKKGQIFSGIKIQNEYLAFGTIQAGLYITDFKGNLVQHLDKSKGLQNNTVLSLYEDKGGQIWLGLDNGIDYIEINSAFTYLNDALGIEGAAYVSKLYQDKLYLGTNQGLYVKKWDKLINNGLDIEKFTLMPNLQGQVWSLQLIENGLFCGHNKGPFELENNSFKKISDEKGAWTFIKIPNKDIIIGGTYFGLSLFKKDVNGKWNFVKKIPGFNESSREIEMDSLNNIWVSHGVKGIFKLKITDSFDSIYSIRNYGASSGLPTTHSNRISKLFNKVVVIGIKGVYEYNYQQDRFDESKLNEIWGTNFKIRNPKVDAKGNIWYFKNSTPAVIINNGGGVKQKEILFNKYSDIIIDEFENTEIIDDDNIIFSTENGFVHFMPSIFDSIKSDFSTHIRGVKLTNANDSLLYNGAFSEEAKKSKVYKIPYDLNAIKFEFVAPYFDQPENTVYRYKLVGFENKWSSWRRNPEKEYTNLPSGEYSFKVESRNIYKHLGKSDSFTFVVLAPWYQSYWAMSVYFVFICILIFVIYRYFKLRFDRAKTDLKKKEAAKLKIKEEEFAKEKLLNKQKIISLKNEKLEAEVLHRQAQMELKNKELASVAIQITHKNEILTDLKNKIENISNKVNVQSRKELIQLTKTIDEDLKLDKDWDQFKKHFEKVHADFFKRLKANYKELTPKDLKMCAYLRMNLSTKEIAPLMNISVRGVEISRYRLRKKLYLEKEANLIEFMLSI